MAKKPVTIKTVETLKHDEAKRKNIPTAEHQSVIDQENKKVPQIRYPRNLDLDPQLVWKGKDEQDWSDLVVNAPPLYIQEKVHPKALIDDLLRQTKEEEHEAGLLTADLFSDFDGIPRELDKTEFYSHEQNWSNRMILGDSLQVMASLAEREGLRGSVQCIYFDPPYGIKFNSNFQWSTTTRDVKDGNRDHITREPEMVKAFRDTWRDGIHSYLTYLRDRLTVARDLLTESGSIFVQIGDENVHRVRALMDEVFGTENYVSTIKFATTSAFTTTHLSRDGDYIIFFSKNIEKLKFRKLFTKRALPVNDSNLRFVELSDGHRREMTREEKSDPRLLPVGSRIYRFGDVSSQGSASEDKPLNCFGREYYPPKNRHWTNGNEGTLKLSKIGRVAPFGNNLAAIRYFDDKAIQELTSNWINTSTGGFNESKTYVVQTNAEVIQRCILMSTDPGDLVLDPTCGSGTTAYVAEQWGRRWITMDTSRVALALARSRVMGARYPYYYLIDSKEGQTKLAEIDRVPVSNKPVFGHLSQGFVCERVPHVTLGAIANNSEIDIIWDKWESILNPLLAKLNSGLGKQFCEWEVPRDIDENCTSELKKVHESYWVARTTRQSEIDKSIASKTEFEVLWDKPYEDKRKVRVAGPFTVESLSPHRVLGVDENDNLVDPLKIKNVESIAVQSFTQMILANLKAAGVQQAHKSDKIDFSSVVPWPGDLICAEGRYLDISSESQSEKRAAIFVGPEFGTVQRADLVQAAREAGEAGFDTLIACAFNYEGHATELNRLGSIPILKARMNADLHMSEDLKNTGKGNLFVVFGEPDIEIINDKDEKVIIKVNGVDVFKPQTGEVISDGADGIACWFIDTDYNEESFFVRHAYFLGANDPYTSLKTSLKAEINAAAWSTLNSDTSRPFIKPKSGRIAVKVINHLGDEVMKVFKI